MPLGCRPLGFARRIAFPDGEHRRYYPNGALQGVWTYKSDKLHGEGVEFYSSGQIKYKDVWLMGNLVRRESFGTNGDTIAIYGVIASNNTIVQPPAQHTTGN